MRPTVGGASVVMGSACPGHTPLQYQNISILGGKVFQVNAPAAAPAGYLILKPMHASNWIPIPFK